MSAETFPFRRERARLRAGCRREGSYLRRSHLTGKPPGQLWRYDKQLVQGAEAFKHLKADRALRPVYHQTIERVQAHLLVAFSIYTLQVGWRQRLKAVASGLPPRAGREKFCAVPRVAAPLPPTAGERTANPVGTTQADLARATATQDHRRQSGCRCPSRGVETAGALPPETPANPKPHRSNPPSRARELCEAS